MITDKIVREDGIESLKRNSSNLVCNFVKDSGGYCKKSDAEIVPMMPQKRIIIESIQLILIDLRIPYNNLMSIIVKLTVTLKGHVERTLSGSDGC